jgi:thiol-disulfide isomerase/thioredoxin
MKLNQIVLTIAIPFLLGCTNNKSEVVIKGKILGKNLTKVEYAVPINGICNFMMVDSVKPDASGNFQIVISSEKPEFILLRATYDIHGIIIAEPGKNYDVLFDLSKDKDCFQVFGENEFALNQYNKLPNPTLLDIYSGSYIFQKDSVASSIKEKIANQKAEEIAIFQNLFNRGRISEGFLRLIQIDRNCYYATVSAAVVQRKYNVSTKNDIRKLTDEQKVLWKFSDDMKTLWEETFQQPLFLQEDITRSPWWFFYFWGYINFKEYINNDLSQTKLEEITKNNLGNTYLVDEARKYLPKSVFESYFANNIYYVSFMFRGNEYELITLFDQFVNEYPNSNYTKYLTPFINGNRNYHKKIAESKFSENVKFINDFQNINSLKESVESLKGKKVYVDVWATWCGDCRTEFTQKEKLRTLLESKGIEMLYISIDKDERDQQWKDMIKYYNLEGYHIRANKQMYADLIRIFNQNGSIAIPWHILIDEGGNIVKDPSELEALEKGIK